MKFCMRITGFNEVKYREFERVVFKMEKGI